MRSLKMLGLLTALALTAMALVGAGSAAAGTQVTGCLGTLEIKDGQMKCVGEYDLKSNMNINASASESAFEGGFSESCGKSNLAMVLTTGKEAGTEGMLNVTGLSFSGECKPCSKVEATGLPYSNGTVLMPSESENSFAFETGAINMTMSGCPLSISCEYSAKNAQLKYIVSESFTTNELRAEGVVLEKVGGSEFCWPTTKWSATYVTAIPAVWWLTLI